MKENGEEYKVLSSAKTIIDRRRIVLLLKCKWIICLLIGQISLSQAACELSSERTVIRSGNAVAPIEEMKVDMSWIDAYYGITKNNAAEATHIRLIDIDFDKTPELFLSHLGVANSAISHGYSFENGAITDIRISDEFMPPELKLYRKQNTNETMWLASGMFKGGSTYEYIWNEVDFNDLSNVKQSPFLRWEEIWEQEGSSYKLTYRLYENENGTIVTKEQLDEYQDALFSQYEPVDELSMFSFISTLEKKMGDVAELDKELFFSFARIYERTGEENLRVDENDPMQFPIYSVININLYNTLTANPPISVIRNGYARQDDEAGASIRLDYIQINDVADQKLKTEINDKLKKAALSDWDVKTEKNIKLTKIQSPSIYQDFLSVSDWEDCDIKGEVHPWTSMSAMTFHMKTGEEVVLSDIMTADERLKQKVFAGDFMTDRFSYVDCQQFEIYHKLWNVMTTPNQNEFYLTEYSIVFIIDVPHIMGDYMTFEILYKELKEWMRI